jgi:hypothetical protein
MPDLHEGSGLSLPSMPPGPVIFDQLLRERLHATIIR